VSVAVLEVEGLRVGIGRGRSATTVVQDICFHIDRGEILALVGESGCGKTTIGLALMRLLPPQMRIEGGAVRLHGRDVLALSPPQMREVRGAEMAMIFQEPMTSLDPVYPIGRQITEAIRAHRPVGDAEARRLAIAALERVQIPAARDRLGDYPHQLSGGMRQRVMIAMALCLRPQLLIADEPTTALDVTIQAQILRLLVDLQAEMGMAILLITHNLAVVAEVANRLCVMYAGRIVETGPADRVLGQPAHPYTMALLDAIPRMDVERRHLPVIPGRVPVLGAMPPGCRFAPRCPRATDICHQTPVMEPTGPAHFAACWHPGSTGALSTAGAQAATDLDERPQNRKAEVS
jgi:oligopeptide/dipeptide ABC transporter ATP-binding protein